MIEQTFDDGGQWAEREAIAGREWRWRRTIFRAGAMITAAKRNRRELSRVVMRYPRGKPDFNRLAAGGMMGDQTAHATGSVDRASFR
jgi:hypothetical protein